MDPLIIACGERAHAFPTPQSLPIIKVSAVPTRQELSFLDEHAKQLLPHDPTPSLEEIQASPDVAHLGAPKLSPQAELFDEVPRLVVIGTDAGLSAVITRMMRQDYVWFNLGYVPVAESKAAANWALPQGEKAFEVALGAAVRPVPLIRDDTAIAVAGSAMVCDFSQHPHSTTRAQEISAEVIVDDRTLIRHEGFGRSPKRGIYGASFVPMLNDPGLVAAIMDTPVEKPKTRFFARPFGTVSGDVVYTGRALQAGGENLLIGVDGQLRQRPVKRVTFYRHLRDLQIIRP